jgi:hypothetical protein
MLLLRHSVRDGELALLENRRGVVDRRLAIRQQAEALRAIALDRHGFPPAMPAAAKRRNRCIFGAADGQSAAWGGGTIRSVQGRYSGLCAEVGNRHDTRTWQFTDRA